MYAPAPIPNAHMCPLSFTVLAPAPCQPPPHSPFYSVHLHLLYTLPPTHPHPFPVPATLTHSTFLPPAPMLCLPPVPFHTPAHLQPSRLPATCTPFILPACTHTSLIQLPVPAPLLFCLPTPT
ncbi:hypothetical protein B0H14DRAFT_3508222 [Mycena olivaceomarginata]|nr:hypothetical protein B0H14DRAFT_3508222 [Mycena olivaceomarginata]